MKVERRLVYGISMVLVLYALCVPLLHGHLPGTIAHVHQHVRVTDLSAGPAHETLDVDHASGDGHEVGPGSDAPLPVSPSIVAFVLTAASLLISALAGRPRPLVALGSTARTGDGARASPVGRFEVIRV